MEDALYNTEDALLILLKWHNWIATGQMKFRDEHLDESEAALKKAGFRVVDRNKLKEKLRNEPKEPRRNQDDFEAG